MKARIEPLAATLGIRERSIVGVEVLGCLLALTGGYAAASNRGELALVAAFALAFCIVAAAVYIRDPIGALIWLWLFEVFNAPFRRRSATTLQLAKQFVKRTSYWCCYS